MPQLVRRSTFMAALIAAPAIAAALGLVAIEGYRLVRPDSPLFGDEQPASLADAVTHGFSVERAYAFIRAGQDPNQPIVVDNPDYTGGRSIRVSPLMLAVAAHDSNVVRMLFSFGARLDLQQNRLAPCLAQELRDEEIVEIIARDGGVDVPQACPDRRPDAAPPLLRWLD